MAMLSNTPALVQRGLNALDKLEQVMGLVLEALDTQVEQLAITDRSPDAGLQKDFPVKGAQRWILHRTPDGRTLEIPEVLTDVLPSDVNRFGGTVVNSGTKLVRLYLADVTTKNAGSAPVSLYPEGGSWDFRLGNMLWSGAVCALAVGGASSLDIVEV